MIGLGGTIAMTRGAGAGVTPRLTAQDRVEATPGLSDVGADLEVITFRNRPGASLNVEDLLEPSRILGNGFAAGAVGAVITQGTDSIEDHQRHRVRLAARRTTRVPGRGPAAPRQPCDPHPVRPDAPDRGRTAEGRDLDRDAR